MLAKILLALTDWVDRRVGWGRLPRPLGILTLIGIRVRLRQRNLQDTGLLGATPTLKYQATDPTQTARRTTDGTLNDLALPQMGSVGMRFGRNVPLTDTFPEPDAELLLPSPRTVSLELMTRERFIPATTLNVLGAAWIQFEVHDWFSHGQNDADHSWKLPLAADDDWPERPMSIPRTRRDPTSDGNLATPPTFVTADSHWWDGSQIYGSKPEFAEALRLGVHGKLRICEDGLPPPDLDWFDPHTDVGANFWLGLGLLHTLFMREHNSICERLRREHPAACDDWLYDKARLINAALMAKIHHTEWTPAIIAHPTTRYAMRATWSGLVGERVGRHIPHLGPDIVSGIPGSKTKHFGVPYSLTEEFVAVYRMHPLLPDEFLFHRLDRDEPPQALGFPELGAQVTRAKLAEIGMANALYSFGIAHPGVISLYNFPRSLQRLERPGNPLLDLAAVDILRNRERGVPRYNQFRRLLRLKPAESFEELTGDDKVAKHVRRVYRDEIERVDLMVGLYAEPKPEGFGFSDTAFRVFILMASRRLQSDRFFTSDYTPAMYTPAGLAWISDNTMVSVLLRHFPSLYPALRGVENAFGPWARVR